MTPRSVIVTGGAQGIGRGIAKAFADAGDRVTVCGRRPVEDVDPPHGVAYVSCDLREPEGAAALIRAVVEKAGRLDVLINCAGGSPPAPAAGTSPRFFASVVALNLLAPYYCAREAHPHLAAAGGSIINIGSISGLRASPGTSAYGAAKAGLVNLTATLAVEWAPVVRVNCISGGLLDSGAKGGASAHYGGDIGAIAATIPMGRMGTPADIAGACLFLASPQAGWITGANLVVDGGGERPAFLDAATPL